jgi:PD-(D/E)XK nuclease superfamily
MLKREYRKYGRCYVDGEGHEFPGVTSILNVMEKKLDWWKMDVSGNYILDQIEAVHRGERLYDRKKILAEGKKAPDNYRDLKGAQGTRIHKVIEKRLNNEDITVQRKKDVKLSAIMFQIEKWIDDNELEPVLVEAYLLSREHGYAGAVDLVARQNSKKYGPQLILVDMKTGRSLQREHTWQMAAYATAYEEMYCEPIDMAFILHIDYDNQIIKEERHLHKADIPKEFYHFLSVYGAFKARHAKYLQGVT